MVSGAVGFLFRIRAFADELQMVGKIVRWLLKITSRQEYVGLFDDWPRLPAVLALELP